MALSKLAPLLVPQFPKKKFLLQMTLWGKYATSAPEPNFIQVLSHNHGSTKVQGHKCYITHPMATRKRPIQQEKGQDHQIQEEED
jgi:hypothetical protein